MHVVITGASGLIGSALVDSLRARGTSIAAVSRDPAAQPARDGVHWIGWDAVADAVSGAAGVVHLAGAGIVDRRWSDARKAELRGSRIESTKRIVEAIQAAAEKPAVLVSASAIGYYGSQVPREITESAPAGNDFLARLCVDWEEASAGAGVRTVNPRIGIVLSADGGALLKMMQPAGPLNLFKLGLGGPIGRGRAYWSWIHLDDAVGIIMHALETPSVEGPLNATAPKPASNADLAKAIGRAFRRPALLPVPPQLLKLLFGEGASVLLASQRVLPTRTLDSGYRFAHPEIGEAVQDLVG